VPRKRPSKKLRSKREDLRRRRKRKNSPDSPTKLEVPTLFPRPTMPTTLPKVITLLWLSLTSRVVRRVRTRRVTTTVLLKARLVDFRPLTSETPREDAPRTRTSRMMSLKVNFPEKPLKERDPEKTRLTMALLTLPLPSVRRPERATPTLMPTLALTILPSRRDEHTVVLIESLDG